LTFTSGGELDIALVDLVWIGEFAENGWILPVDQFAKDAALADPNLNLQGFFPLLLEAFGSWGGTTYGLPFDNYSGLLFYNSCMLKDAGFDKPPETWTDLLQTYAPKLTNKDKGPTRLSLSSPSVARRSRRTASCGCSGHSAVRCWTRSSAPIFSARRARPG
jgi:multiple sugar transport system substrate-binding protein